MRFLTIILVCALCQSLIAQFTVGEPIVNVGKYAITDSVYMDPNGSDSNPGTFALPVKSFNVAMQKLPFGTAGVNGGNAYGVIRLKPGYYNTVNGFRQTIADWKNGNVYRNVSVEGLGEVMIGGTTSTFAKGSLLMLVGDHIYIKNITLKYSEAIGLFLSRNDVTLPRQNNVLVEHVMVDSVSSFCMLLSSVDSIKIIDSKALHSSRPGNGGLTSPCQWPSGLKFFNCMDGTIHHSEVAYSRGEGLNFQNSIRCQAYQNLLHDNGLNFYNDNSSKLYVHHNMLYNTPGIGTQYWRNCPSDTDKIWASGGMLIANEGSCVYGSLPASTNCQTKCVLPNETIPDVDSMFVYNNIFQNVGEAIGFWEGGTGHVGINCIRNVFIYHNTIIGVMGMPGVGNGAVLKFYFPGFNIFTNSNYSYLQNVKISNNIFTYDTAQYPTMRPIIMTFHPQHPGPKDITFSNNLWVKSHAYLGVGDQVRGNLPSSAGLLLDSLDLIQPCLSRPALTYQVTSTYTNLTTDYMNRIRNSPLTNVGALEYSTSCKTVVKGLNTDPMPMPEIYPNPCQGCHEVKVQNLPHEEFSYRLLSINGTLLRQGKVLNDSIDVNALSHGLYILVLQADGHVYVKKLILEGN